MTRKIIFHWRRIRDRDSVKGIILVHSNDLGDRMELSVGLDQFHIQSDKKYLKYLERLEEYF